MERLLRTDFAASIPACLEPRLEAFADRVAVAGPDGDVTYEQLNRRANRIAHWIERHHAAEAGAIVLLLDHGASFLAGALAALKTGRVYVPLDPTHPTQRNKDIVGDAEATLCLTDSGNVPAARAAVSDTCRVVTVEELGNGGPDHNPGFALTSEAESAIYYTSGSTGTPKGVVQTHRSFLARLYHFAEVTGMTPDDRLLFLRHVSTTASVKLFLAALYSGATLCTWDLKSIGTAGLFDWLDAQGVTICPMPVNIFRRAIAEVPDGREFPTVRLVVLASDRVYPSDVELWKRHFPNSRTLIHHVSCNEAETYARNIIDRSMALPDGVLPVGYPADGVELLLWDENGTEVAPGAIGEVIVKGRYHAKGYWKRPDLTARAFLPVDGTDERLYRTGDLGVMADDGCLRLAGRNDDRVRILGNRVEISEVEAALLGLDGIDEVAAVVEPQGEGGKHDLLAAYYVSHGGAPSIGDIRAKLSETMMRSMIPTKLVRLDALPRTATAKIDHRALAARGTAVEVASRSDSGPRDDLERMLVGLLVGLLNVAPIGIDDDIIAIGADSLTSIELVVAIEKKTGVALPVETIWSRAGTVTELAELIRRSEDGGEPVSEGAVPASRVGYTTPAKFITMQDLVTPAAALVLSAVDKLAWKWTTRQTMRAIAGLYTSLRRRSTEVKMAAISRVLGGRAIDMPHRELVTENLGGHFETMLLRLRGWPEGADAPTVTLEGRAHIDRALARGKGVILWWAPLRFGTMTFTVALKQAGLQPTMLGRPEHGFSPNRFSQLVINPWLRDQAGILDIDRIIIEGDGQQAVAAIRRLLGRNGIILINSIALSDRPVELPYFDGRIAVATGPPRIALATGAALIPAFSARDEDGAFHLVVHPPLDLDDTADQATATHILLQDFIALLEAHVLRHPTAWPDWRPNVLQRN